MRSIDDRIVDFYETLTGLNFITLNTQSDISV